MFTKFKKKKQLHREIEDTVSIIDQYQKEHSKLIKEYFNEKNPIRAQELMTQIYCIGYTIAQLRNELSSTQQAIKSL